MVGGYVNKAQSLKVGSLKLNDLIELATMSLLDSAIEKLYKYALFVCFGKRGYRIVQA
jgi:hypothetical protein